jgi:cytochrome c oxidase assembly protein subunit 15
MNRRILSYYTKLLVGVTFLLIIAGGLVTSTKSGLSVPDWPLSYGQLMPPMVGGIRYEHTHRIIASLVGLMTLILAIWIGFSESRRWVRWAGIGALGLVVAQGILGGMTVLYLLPAPISILHACLAQTFFSVTVCLAFAMSKEWNESRSHSSACLVQRPAIVMIALIYVQLILGATLRHTANPLVSVSHIFWGFAVLIHAIMLMMRTIKHCESDRQLIRPALFFGLVTFSQLLLGFGAFIYAFLLPQGIQPEPAKVFFITAHQALGALVLATSVFLALRIHREAV